MKNKRLIFITLFILLVSVSSAAVASAEEKSYQSSSDISFYGEYVDPSKEKPDMDEGSNLGNIILEKETNKLPQTGELFEMYYLSMGIIVAGLGLLLIKYKKYWRIKI
ncbi:LPXTG cell wall anchor domain-containing protein [Carnobacterium divergens]|uniref:LPXTG cell wall anchor domain-containing protein n=1 Tax=Carnobacterium divergens TaxID=2748 RepID=A0AAW8REI7_CARDV|nr:LPXTG cell wall anchor domain-containing protein [Carnobacterium divergens]MDT1958936.1 LPXTG cell wall anchor domain-containing protein [Carnobacterium divergens]MDT1974904.1 LPXTG cell wall anchor domain-containing protein [Carnobacterium divergens]MDT2012956.1 LPXTG cell wall anchor domain-containing protein [Carnobacterium divergens]